MELDPRNPVMVRCSSLHSGMRLWWGRYYNRHYNMRGGGAVSVDCGTGVVGGPASAFLSGTDGCVDLAGDVAVGVTSPAVLAGEVAVVMASPAVAGAASLADAGVAPLADAGVPSLADAGVASLADAGVASLANSGVASLADHTGSVASGVTDWTVPVRVRTEKMTFLREAVAGIVRFLMIWCVAIVKWIVVIVHRPTLGVGRCRRFVTILGMIRGQGERVVILTDRMLLMAGLSFPGVGQVLG